MKKSLRLLNLNMLFDLKFTNSLIFVSLSNILSKGVCLYRRVERSGSAKLWQPCSATGGQKGANTRPETEL